MRRIFLRRLLLFPLVLLGISAAVFLSVRLVPGDPALVVLGLQATAADIAAMRHKLGLDKPIPIQFGIWLSGAIRGDFGESLLSSSPVLPLLVRRYIFTLQLAFAGVTLAAVLGVASGMISAAKRHSPVDNLVMIISLAGVSTPAFWLGIMLILIFGLHFNWLPTGGSGGLRYLILPAVSLGAFSWGVIARMTRASILEVLNQDYIRTARAKGVRNIVVLIKHALKNALLPVLTVIGIQFGYLLAGAVVTESVFNWPGVGRLLVSSILQRDFPVVQGAVLVIAASFVAVNMLVDIGYAWVDPRIRY